MLCQQQESCGDMGGKYIQIRYNTKMSDVLIFCTERNTSILLSHQSVHL